MAKFILQRWATKHDTNGNPRRLWMVFRSSNGSIESVIEDGYSGKPEIPDSIEISNVDVTPSEYQSTKRFAKDSGKYVNR